MSEDNIQIIENQEAIKSLNDLNKRKEFFAPIQNFQAGESPSENSLIIISNIDGDILSLIEKLISLGACNFNGLSFYEFEEQKFISEEELIPLISLKKIANENVKNNFTQMINNFFMLPDLNEVSNINITEKINNGIQRLNSKKYVKNPITFIKDNNKLFFTQKIEDNDYKIVISKESNPSNMDFFYNDICVLKDKMPKDFSNFWTIQTYPLKFLDKISDILNRTQHSFYVLPNLQINPNFNQKIIFSGNIICEFKSVPCLLLMEHLVTANPNIKFLIGDQEIILKDTPQNTSLILRKLVKNNKLSTGIITQDNSFFYNIFLPSHLPQLFEILQALQNENSDLPIEYKKNWQVQFDKLSPDLKAKINLEIPFIEKNDKAKSIKDIMAKSRAKTYINLNGYELYCELKNNEFTDKDFIELKNAIGNIFFDLSYLDERLIKKYLSRNENYDNWIFGKINSISDGSFFDIKQNTSDFNSTELLKILDKHYKVIQTENTILSAGNLIGNESYSYQKFYKSELYTLFEILAKIYDEFVFIPSDPDKKKNNNTLFIIRNNPEYFNKLSDEQKEKTKSFCDFIVIFQEANPEIRLTRSTLPQAYSNYFNTFPEDFELLLDAYFNYPYLIHKNIFDNRIAILNDNDYVINNKFKSFIKNFSSYISNNNNNNFLNLIEENFEETDLFKMKFAIDNFFCDLYDRQSDIGNDGELFGINIAKDFADKLMTLKIEQNKISDSNFQAEVANLEVENFSITQHIYKDQIKIYNKQINIIHDFQFNFDTQNNPNELNELLSNYKNNLSEDDLINLFSYEQKISNDNQLTELLNKISELNEFMLETILDFTEPEICGFKNLVVILNKFSEKLNVDLIDKIFKKCKNNIFNNENLDLFLSKIQINKINIAKNNYHIFADKVLNSDNIIKLLNAGFLIDFYLENDEFYLNNTDHFKLEGTKYSEVINSFFKKFDGTIFIQENAEQINNAIENNEARTNFNDLCNLYHKLHKDKSNEGKNKENENDNENNKQNDNDIANLSDESKNDTNGNNNLDVTENTSNTNENDDKNSNKHEPTNQNSALKNFKIGISLGIGFLSAALIFGILFYVFFSTIAAIATAASLITIAVITMISAKIIYGKKMKTKYENLNKNSGINISSETENENANNLNGFNKNSPDQSQTKINTNEYLP